MDTFVNRLYFTGNMSRYFYTGCFVPILLFLHQIHWTFAEPDLPDDFCTNRVGGLLPHPSDCSRFVICTYGRTIIQTCAPSMLFDAQLKACNFEHSTSCGGEKGGRPRPVYVKPDRLNTYYDKSRYDRDSNERKDDRKLLELTYSQDRNDYIYHPVNQGHDRRYPDYRSNYREHPERSSNRNPYNGLNANNVYNHFYNRESDISEPDYRQGDRYSGHQAKQYINEDSRQSRQYSGEYDGYQTRQVGSYREPINERFNRPKKSFEENIRQREVYNGRNNRQREYSREPDYSAEKKISKEFIDELPAGIINRKRPVEEKSKYIPNRSFVNNRKSNEVKREPDYKKNQIKSKESGRGLKSDVDKSMFHFVHADVPDPHIFKRVRRPGETFVAFSGIVALQEEESICEHGDGLYADSGDCTKYIQCANGSPYKKSCPPGTYFTSSSGTCGYDTIGCADGGVAGQVRAKNKRKGKKKEKVKAKKQKNDDDMDMDAIEEFMRTSLVEAKQNALEIIHQEVLAARLITAHPRPFGGVAAFLGSTPYVKQLSLPAFLQLECLRMIKTKFDLDKGEILIVMKDMGSALPSNPSVVSPDMTYPIPSMSSCPFPKNDDDNDCDPNARYRTYDGSCNNLHHPLWGKSFRAVGRFLQPDYADGIGELRRAKSGLPLPSARAVSVKIYTPSENSESHVHTVMMMTFGQFLAHDLVRTAVTKLSKEESGTGEMVDVMCGESECETEGAENRACEPIPVLRGDRDFTNKSCLMFVRTQEVMRDSCELAPREQLNQLTSWLDASMVYGSTKNESEALRDKTRPMRGQLATIRHPFDHSYHDLLPQKENKDCRDLNNTIQCFNAGDGRVNEQIGLIALHTVFTRAHNTWEEELHDINPHWDGERLFQETRRIMAAAWQVIIYNEYLPLVLGPESMRRHGLVLEKTGYWDGYSPSTNPDVTNSFATAAFRFGHSQIGDVIRLTSQLYKRSKDLDFSTVLRRPATVYETRLPAGSAVDSIILGMVSQAAEMVDTHFSKEMTVRLFSENPPKEPGLDLPAINTQRGRDHGIPSYNYWREWCGLSVARTFDEMVDVPYETRLKLSELYDDVDDVDLFPAGITERHIPGGVVGPTFGCILARQFRALRVSDRYWHERPDPNLRFTPAQLQALREVTLARVVCDNTDRVDNIQRFVMMQPLSQAVKTLGHHNYMEAYNIASLYHGENNERHPCSHLPKLDLTKWKENRTEE